MGGLGFGEGSAGRGCQEAQSRGRTGNTVAQKNNDAVAQPDGDTAAQKVDDTEVLQNIVQQLEDAYQR